MVIYICDRCKTASQNPAKFTKTQAGKDLCKWCIKKQGDTKPLTNPDENPQEVVRFPEDVPTWQPE